MKRALPGADGLASWRGTAAVTSQVSPLAPCESGRALVKTGCRATYVKFLEGAEGLQSHLVLNSPPVTHKVDRNLSSATAFLTWQPLSTLNRRETCPPPCTPLLLHLSLGRTPVTSKQTRLTSGTSSPLGSIRRATNLCYFRYPTGVGCLTGSIAHNGRASPAWFN